MEKLLLKIIFNICLKISDSLDLEYWIMGSTSSAHSYRFFLDWGPKLLIVRNNDVEFLGSAFSITVEFNEKKELLHCRPQFMCTEEKDLVFYGREKAYDAYRKYYIPRGTNIELAIVN